MVFTCGFKLGVKALTVEDLLQAQKEISAHNRQLKEQTKQIERDMALLRDESLTHVSSYRMWFGNILFWKVIILNWNLCFVLAKVSVWGAEARLGLFVFGESVKGKASFTQTDIWETEALSWAAGM